MSLEELFGDILLDHYHHPRHHRSVPDPDAQSEGANPLCGDEITLSVKVDGEKITDIGFTSKACAICTASTSIFCENALGKSVEDIDQLQELFYRMLSGKELTEMERARLGDAVALAGVGKLPARVKCATLVYETWKELKKLIKPARSQAAVSSFLKHNVDCECGDECDCSVK